MSGSDSLRASIASIALGIAELTCLLLPPLPLLTFLAMISPSVSNSFSREEILLVHMRKIPSDVNVKADIIARGTPGFSGADLANLVNEAALLASRKRKTYVDNGDFQEAQDKVLMGVQRKSMVLSDHEKKVTAYHEAGHAVCLLYTSPSPRDS